jgi:hypothetical protein
VRPERLGKLKNHLAHRFGLENREYSSKDHSRWSRVTFYPQEFALISPTSGGRSVGIVLSRTQATDFLAHRVSNPRPSGLQHSALTTTIPACIESNICPSLKLPVKWNDVSELSKTRNSWVATSSGQNEFPNLIQSDKMATWNRANGKCGCSMCDGSIRIS